MEINRLPICIVQNACCCRVYRRRSGQFDVLEDEWLSFLHAKRKQKAASTHLWQRGVSRRW